MQLWKTCASLRINEHKKPAHDINVFTFLSASLQIKACNIKAFYKQKKKRILLSHFPCDFRKKSGKRGQKYFSW